MKRPLIITPLACVLTLSLAIMVEVVTTPVAVAGAVSKTIKKSIVKKLRKGQAGQLTKMEATALRRELTILDRNTLNKIERVYGMHITPESMRAVRGASTRFCDHNVYQAQLKKMYPKMTDAERKKVVGNTMTLSYVDKNQPLLPRIVAHERIHQLSNPRLRTKVGAKMDEGMTEYLARYIYGDVSIKNLPKAYPRQTEVVQMLATRVGKQKIARAYFRGRDALQSLASDLDKQLGKGAFDALVRSMKGEEYKVARGIIKYGVLR